MASTTVEIARPPAEVFAFVSDPAKLSVAVSDIGTEAKRRGVAGEREQKGLTADTAGIDARCRRGGAESA